MTMQSTGSPSLLTRTIGIVALCVPASCFAAVTVVNGDFQNTTGLTSLGGGWYGGVPVGWHGVGNNYSVGTDASSSILANIEQASTATPSFNPLYQDLGVLDSDSTITLTFTLSMPWNANPINVGAAIWAGSGFSTTLASTSFITTTGTQTLTAFNVPAGTDIQIGFWRSASVGSPGLDNVSMTVTPVPEPSPLIMGLGGAALLALGCRRRSRSK